MISLQLLNQYKTVSFNPLNHQQSYTFGVDYPGLKELGDVEYDAEGEDGDDIEQDPPADCPGLCEAPVGVGVADSTVPDSDSEVLS